jgi:hypothetical protein
MGVNILGRCANNTTLSRLRASTFGLVSRVMSGLKVHFGVTAFQDFVTMNALSVPVTARSLSAPSCSVAQEDGAMDDSADIPVARDGTAPPVRRRASTSGWDSAVVREPSFDLAGLRLGIRSRAWAVDLSVGQQLECAELLGCGRFDEESHCRCQCGYSSSLCQHNSGRWLSCVNIRVEFRDGNGAEMGL